MGLADIAPGRGARGFGWNACASERARPLSVPLISTSLMASCSETWAGEEGGATVAGCDRA